LYKYGALEVSKHLHFRTIVATLYSQPNEA